VPIGTAEIPQKKKKKLRRKATKDTWMNGSRRT